MRYTGDTNVGLGMVPHRKGCRCADCEIDRLQPEISRLTENQRLQDSATAAVMERAEKAEAELAKCREDAERLRAFGSQVAVDVDRRGRQEFVYPDVNDSRVDLTQGSVYQHWCAAIDSARKGRPNG